VEAEILEQGRDKKMIVFKYKKRKQFRKKHGHRQSFTDLRITKISGQEG
jgi:large subunit ribosomal protein L21